MSRAAPMNLEDRRAAIIAATQPLLLERGLVISTKEIADACGIAEGTLFRAFPTKEALLDAVISHALDPSDLIVQVHEVRGDLPTRVGRLVELLATAIQHAKAIMMVIHQPEPCADRPHPHHRKSAHLERLQHLQQAIADVLVDDELRVDASVAAAFLQQSVFGAVAVPFSQILTDTDLLTDLILSSLVKDPACSTTH